MSRFPIRRGSIAALSQLLVASALLVGCGSQTTSGTPPATAAVDDSLDSLSNDALVRKLLEVTGAGDLGQQLMDGMAKSFEGLPGLPAGFLEHLMKNARSEDFVELIVPIYLKHFDRATLIAAIRFYGSEQGSALIAKQPAVVAESMEAGKRWGERIADKTLREMEAEASAGH